jgi:hypothetical protein
MGKIRVSVGNLAPRLMVAETGEAFFFGILNRGALMQGRRLVSAVGGAAEMTEAGKALLASRFGAEFQEGMDARFLVEEGRLEEVLQLFEARDTSLYEIDPSRELMEELATKELPIQDAPALTSEEAASLTVRFAKTARQRARGSTSAREVEGMPTRRLFNLFEIVAPMAVVEKLKQSSAIYFLSEEEIATTQGGFSQGHAFDGSGLADNLMW